MLGQMPRKSQQLIAQPQQLANARVVRIETRLFQPLTLHFPPAAPAGGRLHQLFDLLHGQAQGLARVPQGAPGAVGDHRGRQGGAVAAVFAIDVLDDLFTALVLEVHVDVRRLAALPGDEALEQQIHARRIHLGDAQAVAHGGIGRRAPALAENMLPAGKGHDVPDGKKVGSIVQLVYQPQLMFDLRLHPVRTAFWPARLFALFHQLPQVVLGLHTRRRDIIGIVVAQFVQGKTAAPGDAHALLQQRWRVE